MVVLSAFSDFMTDVLNIIKRITFFDVLDIVCVAVILYLLYKFIRDRRAGKLALGVVLLLVMRALSELLDMYLLSYLLQSLFQVGIVILVILFQPELRSALEKMGAVPLKGIKSIGDIKHMGVEAVIDEVTSAVSDLASTKTGALIVFERETKLGDMILTGTVIDATPTSAMIRNIFFNKAPMHDGALIIRNGRLHAAGCFLPLSSNPDIIKDLGTRHRAGIGMSENSDAVVIIVSEETGIVSTAVEGRLVRGYREETLKSFLMKELSSESGEAEKLTVAQRIKRFFSRKEKKSDEEKGE